MARIGFCGPSYESISLNADAQKCLNFYTENVESGSGASGTILVPTPGLELFAALPGNSYRGGTDINGRHFVVVDGVLYEVFADKTSHVLGNVAIDGNPVSFGASVIELLVASGGSGYVFNLTSGVFTGPIANLNTVIQVGYTDGYFVALLANSQTIILSGLLDGLTWDPAQKAIVSVFPGLVKSMVVDHREICLLGNRQSVCYYDSGAVFPYDVIPGGFMEKGCEITFGATKLDNSYLWWGEDKDGGRMAWRAQGYSPARISTHALENEIKNYAKVTDAVSYSYQEGGHTHWVTDFPSAEKAWAYDVATSSWHERRYWNTLEGAYHSPLVQFHTWVFGKHLVGGRQSGNIYQMSEPVLVNGVWKFATDNGAVIRRVRRSPHINTELQRARQSSLQIHLETGLGPIPPLAGQGSTTVLVLASANGSLWNLLVLDTGIEQVRPDNALGDVASTLFLNNPANTLSWQITVSNLGILVANPVALGNYPNSFLMVSISGTKLYSLQINGGITQFVDQGSVARDPQGVINWSDDGGHTWRGNRIVNCGQAGKYRTRARILRLGAPRDRVFEFVWAEPVPCRIIDAYLQGEGMPVTKRLAASLREQS